LARDKKQMAMTYRLALAGVLHMLMAGAQAQTVYVCVDAHGHKEYTDSRRANCRALDLPNAIPAPTGHRSALALPAPALAPANFPRVDSAQQKARDGERRDILAEELRSEEKKLGELKKDFNNGAPERQASERDTVKYQERVAQLRDNIGRSEKNIEAIKRELASVK
jgi:septal ring factor EnvC (AmiA/AmiB activator)